MNISTLPLKRMLGTILLFVFCAWALVCAVLYFLQEKLIFYPERLPPGYAFTFEGNYREVDLPVDGATLNALHFRATRSKGVVLYLHGNAGNLSSWGTIAPLFTKCGYDLFIMDYRGYGKSTGAIRNEKMLHDDAAASFNHLLEEYAEEQIIVYGCSIGTGPATLLAGRHRPRLLTLQSPYYNLTELARSQYPWIPSFLLKYPFPINEWIGEVKCPVYIFHGTEDTIIPHHSSLRLVKLIKAKHKLMSIHGAGHNDLGGYPLYHEQLAQLLKQH